MDLCNYKVHFSKNKKKMQYDNMIRCTSSCTAGSICHKIIMHPWNCFPKMVKRYKNYFTCYSLQSYEKNIT